MKAKLLLTTVFFTILNNHAFSFGVSISVGGKKLQVGKPKKVKLPTPPRDSILAKPLGTGEGSVSKTASNAKKIVDTGIHDSGKVLGDGVKGLRNSIAQMQGLNVEKTKKELKSLTSKCRQDNHNLNLVNKDLEELHKFAITERKFSSDNTHEYYEKLDKKIKSLNHLTNGAGTVGSAGATTFNIGFFSNASWGGKAMSAGVYTMAAAAVVIAMNESVKREIKIEEDKLNKCAKKFNINFNRYEALYAKNIKLLNTNKEKANSQIDITNDFNELKRYQTACMLEIDECPSEVKFKELKSKLEMKILEYINKYGESKTMKEFLNETKGMEI